MTARWISRGSLFLLVLVALAALLLASPSGTEAIPNCCVPDIGPTTPGVQQPIPHEHTNAPLAPGGVNPAVRTGPGGTFPSGLPPGFPPLLPHPPGVEAVPNFRHSHRWSFEWSAGQMPLAGQWTVGGPAPAPAGIGGFPNPNVNWSIGWDNHLLRMDLEPFGAGAMDNEHAAAPVRHDFGHHFIDEFGYGFDGPTQVTYSFDADVPANVRDVISQAFADWGGSKVQTTITTLRTGIEFQQVSSGGDIQMMWDPLAYGTWAGTVPPLVVPIATGALPPAPLILDASLLGNRLWIIFNNAIGPETGAQCADAVDNDGDGRVNEGCPTAGGAAEVDVVAGSCVNAVNDDPADDGVINDGCPTVGLAPEAGGACADAVDNDADGFPNDGCPLVGTGPDWSHCRNSTNDDPGDDAMVNDGCPSEDGWAFGRISGQA